MVTRAQGVVASPSRAVKRANGAGHGRRERGPEQARERCHDDRVGDERAQHAAGDRFRARIGPVELDGRDRDREQRADGEQGGEDRGRQRARSEQAGRERDAHEAGVRVGARERLDAAVGEPVPASGEQEGRGIGREQHGGEAEDEAGVGDEGAAEMDAAVEQQRRQREIDGEAVEAVGGRRAEHAEPARDEAGRDQAEQRQHGREHDTRSPARRDRGRSRIDPFRGHSPGGEDLDGRTLEHVQPNRNRSG